MKIANQNLFFSDRIKNLPKDFVADEIEKLTYDTNTKLGDSCDNARFSQIIGIIASVAGDNHSNSELTYYPVSYIKDDILNCILDFQDKDDTVAPKYVIRKDLIYEGGMSIVAMIVDEAYDIKLLLNTLKQYQIQYPDSHIGGSIGLFLHGIDLDRNLSNSDLDIISPTMNHKSNDKSDEPIAISTSDFDFNISFNGAKIDLRIDDTQQYVVINYFGCEFNVSMLSTIIEWKTNYCIKQSSLCEKVQEYKKITEGKGDLIIHKGVKINIATLDKVISRKYESFNQKHKNDLEKIKKHLLTFRE